MRDPQNTPSGERCSRRQSCSCMRAGQYATQTCCGCRSLLNFQRCSWRSQQPRRRRQVGVSPLRDKIRGACARSAGAVGDRTATATLPKKSFSTMGQISAGPVPWSGRRSPRARVTSCECRQCAHLHFCLPPQGALFSPAKWPPYGLHMAVVKKPLRRVCTKFVMLIL